MNVRISRFLVAAAIAGLVLIGGSPTVEAQSPCPASPNYSPDFSVRPDCVALNGTATFVSNALQLTTNTGDQAGSAWYGVKQPVQNGFSTTFKFQFTNGSAPPADGIAFVIQNSAASAIGYTGGNGGALAYGDADASTDPSSGAGIPNSLAIEFDDFQNTWDPAGSHVAVQTCGTGPNTSHHSQTCSSGGPNSTIGPVVSTSNFADGAVHIVTVTYTPACPTCASGTTANIHVILDNVDINPSGFQTDLAAIGLDSGNAYVGFTGATGGDYETQDVSSWTFTPTSKGAVVNTDGTTIFPMPNPDDTFTAQLQSGNPVTVQVTPVFFDPTACTTIVQTHFPGAQCFVYMNPDGSGVDKSVLFEVTCPQSPGGTCGSALNQTFFATLGTNFDFTEGSNPGFNPNLPFPGWLKGDSQVMNHPCAFNSNNTIPFLSNQITSFFVDSDPAHAKGSSGGTGSCWVATYNQQDEALPGITIVTPANGSFVAQGSAVPANYFCTDPVTSKIASNPTGPYLTSDPNKCAGPVANGSNIDTAAVGSHTFTVNAMDTGSNPNSKMVTYNVVASTDLAILNLALPKVATGGKLTYAIGVGDLGPAAAANVVVNDTLPSGTTYQSASGSVVTCSVVNKKIVCTTTPVNCTGTTAVSCNVGSLAPLSISSLNGATIQITVKVTAAAGSTIKDTATVTGTNTDPKLGNNSSTASTSVTAH